MSQAYSNLGPRIDTQDYGPDALRSYGPGKYDSILDSVIDAAAMDGVDEECGTVEDIGWHGLIHNLASIADDPSEPLTKDELTLLRMHASAIVRTDNAGFTTVEYYKTEREAMDAFEAIEKEYFAAMEDTDND